MYVKGSCRLLDMEFLIHATSMASFLIHAEHSVDPSVGLGMDPSIKPSFPLALSMVWSF